jgi:hypothetical protein
MRTFRRSLGARVLSVGCVLFFALMEGYHLGTGGRIVSLGGILLGSLLAVSFVAAVLNLGDRIRIDDEGIHYANPLLSRFGLRLDREIAWREVVSYRLHHPIRPGRQETRPEAMFLRLASGRRFVIDSIEDFDEMRRMVSERLPGRAAPTRAPFPDEMR